MTKRDLSNTISFEDFLAELEKKQKTLLYKVTNPLYRGCYRLGDLYRALKYKLQSVIRGYGDDEIWDLDLTFYKLMIPRLKRFRELNNGHPTQFTFEEWSNIIDKIIEGFELSLKYKYLEGEANNEQEYKMKKGLKLFHKFINHLWL